MKYSPTEAEEEALETAAVLSADSDFHSDQVLTIVGGHFVHDTFSAFIAPLLPLLQEQLGTNYALTGGLAVFAQIPSLLNPLIGYLADKVSLRYFIILAPGITATIMSSMGLTSTYLGLALLLLAGGVSIAAFHAPAPAMISRVSGNYIGRGMSYFMAGGELGRTFGPLLVAAGVEWFGLGGIWRLAIIGWIVSAILYMRLRGISARPPKAPDSAEAFWPKARRFFPALTWLMFLRVFMLVALTTYLPLFMSDVIEVSLWLAAASLTVLEGAGVAGALITGTLSDRLGRRRVLVALLGSAPLIMLLFLYSPGWLAAPLLIVLGLTAISPTPVLLAMVQDEFPDNRALANGTFLALNFLIRASGIGLVGLVADHFGLVSAYGWSALIAFLSLPAVWFLPWKKSGQTPLP